jgi:GT2 family glycosyltransferase
MDSYCEGTKESGMRCKKKKINYANEPIEVQIPYDTEGKLARAYNRAMARATSEWVLFIDHDLFICNKHWYQMCLSAIEQIGDKTGWITAVTNRIGNPQQRSAGAPMTHNIEDHCLHARRQYAIHGSKVERCKGAMSGFWILTNKTAWKQCGGFDENRQRLLGVDNLYSRALSIYGYKHYRMPGLYVYHIYHQKKKLMRW